MRLEDPELLALRNEGPFGRQRHHNAALPQLLDGSPSSANSDLVLGSKVALSRKSGASRELTCVNPGRDVIRHSSVDVGRTDRLRVEFGHLNHKITIGRP
jgi:hypothetical protein